MIVPMQDADFFNAQTNASITAEANAMHLFLPYALVAIAISLVGYYFLILRPAKTRKTKIWLALIPILILTFRSIYPIYTNFFAKATEVGYVVSVDSTKNQVGFATTELIDVYNKHHIELKSTSPDVVWFNSSYEKLATGDKVEITTQGVAHYNSLLYREVVHVRHLEKVDVAQ